jgi:hypothetical protein
MSNEETMGSETSQRELQGRVSAYGLIPKNWAGLPDGIFLMQNTNLEDFGK